MRASFYDPDGRPAPEVGAMVHVAVRTALNVRTKRTHSLGATAWLDPRPAPAQSSEPTGIIISTAATIPMIVVEVDGDTLIVSEVRS